MQNLSLLRNAISNYDIEGVRDFCNCKQNSYPDIYDFIIRKQDSMEFTKMALVQNNLEIFKIVFHWSRQNGSIWIFDCAIANNQLPFVQYLFPFVQDSLEACDRLYSLEDTKKPGFEALHAWLRTAFHPQIAFENWQAEWGLNIELVFTPSIYELCAEYNAYFAAGKIDEDGYPIEHHGNTYNNYDCY